MKKRSAVLLLMFLFAGCLLTGRVYAAATPVEKIELQLTAPLGTPAYGDMVINWTYEDRLALPEGAPLAIAAAQWEAYNHGSGSWGQAGSLSTDIFEANRFRRTARVRVPKEYADTYVLTEETTATIDGQPVECELNGGSMKILFPEIVIAAPPGPHPVKLGRACTASHTVANAGDVVTLTYQSTDPARYGFQKWYIQYPHHGILQPQGPLTEPTLTFVMPDQPVRVFAEEKALPKMVELTIDLGGGDFLDEGKHQTHMRVEKGSDLVLSELRNNLLPPEGYLLKGFRITHPGDPNYEIPEISFGGLTLYEDTHVECLWERVYGLTIIGGAAFRPGSYTPADQAAPGETVRLEGRDGAAGKYFDHWEALTPADLSITTPLEEKGATFVMPAQSVRLRAVYKAVTEVTSIDLTVSGYTYGSPMSGLTVSSSTPGVEVKEVGIYMPKYSGTDNNVVPPWENFMGGLQYFLEIRLSGARGYEVTQCTADDIRVDGSVLSSNISGSCHFQGSDCWIWYSLPALKGISPMTAPWNARLELRGYDSGKLTNVVGTLRYRMEGDTEWKETTANSGKEAEITGLREGTLQLVQVAGGPDRIDSCAESKVISRKKPPVPIEVHHTNNAEADNGVLLRMNQTDCEWRRGASGPWTPMTGDVGGLTPGLYQVRRMGSGNCLASDPVDRTIFCVQVKDPLVVQPAEESFDYSVRITIEHQPDVTVYFTTDGSDPTDSGNPERKQYGKYFNERELYQSCTVRAVSCYQGYYGPITEKSYRRELSFRFESGHPGLTITVDGKDCSGAAQPMKLFQGQQITLETAVPEGYLFAGWSDSNGNIPEPDKQKNPVTFDAWNGGTISPALAQLVDRIDVHVAPPVIGMAYHNLAHPCINSAGYPLLTSFEKSNGDGTWTNVADKAVFGPGTYRMGVSFFGSPGSYRLDPELKVFINGQEAVFSEPVKNSPVVTCMAYIETEAAPFFRDATADGAGLTLTPAPYYKDYTIVAADYDDDGRMGAAGAYRFTGEETGPITIPVRNFRMEKGRIFILDSQSRPVLSPQSPSGVP